MILLYHATQLSLVGSPENQWSESLDMVKKVVHVLDFCKELDPVARAFSTSLLAHYECFREASQPSGAGDQTDKGHLTPPQPGDYLFTSTSCSAPLHSTSNELFEQLCNPYANGHAIVVQKDSGTCSQSRRTDMLKSNRIAFGCQDNVPLAADAARTSITPKISNLEDGYFIDSNEPNRWIAKRSAVAYSSGAKTLKIL